jgi:hypothetical protein
MVTPMGVIEARREGRRRTVGSREPKVVKNVT